MKADAKAAAVDHSRPRVAEPCVNIVLVEPQIPPNTGAIARLCGAAACPLHIVGPMGFKASDRYLKRAGLDYWDSVDITTYDNLESFIQRHGDGVLWVTSKRVERRHTDVEFSPGDFVLFGHEIDGLPKELLTEHADHSITIPILGQVRSHNLACAASIVLYEALRQLRD
jgi:tRNA (cytidine/uridine-2'-O-)-methyltransferase